MPNKVPVRAAREVADKHDLRQVILIGWDGKLTHIVTYGKSTEDCAQAAHGGNLLKKKWGWPECNDQPPRVRKLEKEIEELKAEIQTHKAEITRQDDKIALLEIQLQDYEAL